MFNNIKQAAGVMKNYWILMLCIPAIALAEPVRSEAVEPLVSSAGLSGVEMSSVVVPSVEDNLREMDRDRNGLVTVSEVRAYLELKHGKGYEKSILDKMQSAERGASCGTPFAQSFY